MQNIRRTRTLILLVIVFCGILFPVFSQNENPQTIIDAAKNAGENTSHKKDREYWISMGYKQGHEEGYSEGYAKGIKKGQDEGYELGFNEKLVNMDSSWLKYAIPIVMTPTSSDSSKIGNLRAMNEKDAAKYYNLQYLADAFWGAFKRSGNAKAQIDLYRESVRRNILEEAYDSTSSKYKEIRAKVYNMGWRDGYQNAYNILLKKGQNITLKEVDLPSTLDYVQLVEDIHTIQGKSIYEDASTFSALIKKIHLDMIDYLSLRLELSAIEREDAILQYERIHPALASQYYEKYLSIYRVWGIEADAKSSFYNYHSYHTTHSLIDIIAWDLCSVADVVLTYSKENSQYASIIGLETGNVCWVLKEDYLQTIYYNLLKVAFGNDLNRVAPQMQSGVQQSLTNFVAEVQKHEKIVTETVELSEGESAQVTMKITSLYTIGFELDEISVDIDHKKQNVNVQVSRTPRLLNIVQQEGVVLKVVTKKEYTETKDVEKTVVGLKPIIKGEEKIYDAKKKETKKIAKVVVANSAFQAIFEKHKPDEEEIKSKMQKLPLDAYENISILLQKVIEPAISLPDANYKATFKYGGKSIQLVTD
ncbi:hypothetical protein ACE193_21155 [Bernardetia sp. OM2101]|uniref:hypothetical protein n=1 Tax=Bernardetia sp. OM2101 TaxID=3344876 RepID=UPI0035CECB2B